MHHKCKIFAVALVIAMLPAHASDDESFSSTPYMALESFGNVVSDSSKNTGLRRRKPVAQYGETFLAAARAPLLAATVASPAVQSKESAPTSKRQSPTPLQKVEESPIKIDSLAVKRLDKFQREKLFEKANKGDRAARSELMGRYLNNLSTCWLARHTADDSIWDPAKCALTEDGKIDYLGVRFVFNFWKYSDKDAMAGIYTLVDRAARQGNVEAQLACADMIRKGYGLEANLDRALDLCRALDLYLAAARQGHGWGAYGAGLILTEKKDVVSAATQFSKAADAGLACAQRELALCYCNGSGVKKDNGLYIHYLQRAAEQGDPWSESSLAQIYEQGTLVASEETTAVKYATRAAEQDYGTAAYRLGLFYLNGYGVGKNANNAMMWLKRAVELGNSDACQDMATLHYKDNFGQKHDIWHKGMLAARYAMQSGLPGADFYIKNVMVYTAANHKPATMLFSEQIDPASSLGQLDTMIKELDSHIHPSGDVKSAIPPLLHSIFDFIKTYVRQLTEIWGKSIIVPMMVNCVEIAHEYAYCYAGVISHPEVKNFISYISLSLDANSKFGVMSYGFQNTAEAELVRELMDEKESFWTEASVALIKKSMLPYAERLALEELGLEELIEDSHRTAEFYTPMNINAPAIRVGNVRSYLTLFENTYTAAIGYLSGKMEGFKLAMRYIMTENGLAKAVLQLKAYERALEMMTQMKEKFQKVPGVLGKAKTEVIARLINTTPLRNELFLKDPKNAGIVRALGIPAAANAGH